MAHRGNHSGLSPVYQIDFTAVASGKRIASTKRRVRWRFGFTNQEALAGGETGTACRGEEHDVTLVWSITSGKRLILADGQEVHYSVSRASNLDATWTMRGNHVLKVIAFATPPINAGPGFRQYDFYIDGQSFFNMPKVYRLGLTGRAPPPPRSGGVQPYNNYSLGGARPPSDANIAAIEMPHNPEEEEAYLQEAIKASLEDNKKEEAAPAPAPPAAEAPKQEENLLLDFFDSPAPAPLAGALPALPAPAPAASHENGFGTSAPQPTLSDISSDFGFGAPTPAPAPAAGYSQPYASQPSAGFTSQPAVGALGFASPSPQPAPAPSFDQTFQQNPVSGSGQFAAPAPPGVPPGGAFNMGSLSTYPPAPVPAANADRAYQNFATANDFNLGSQSDASNPFASTPATQPALGDFKTMSGSNTQAPPKQDVMRAPPPAPGALVVSGNQSGNWSGYGAPGQGAPPMHQPVGQGFGQSQQFSGSGQFGGYGPAPAAAPGYGTYGAQQHQPQQQAQQYQQNQPQHYGQQQQQNFGAPQYQQHY